MPRKRQSARDARARLAGVGDVGPSAPIVPDGSGEAAVAEPVQEQQLPPETTPVPVPESEPTAPIQPEAQEAPLEPDFPVYEPGDLSDDNLGDNSRDNPHDKSAGTRPASPAEIPEPRGDASPAPRPQEPQLNLPYPTGIDVPPDLHAKVQRAAQKDKLKQTVVFLMAFNTVADRIPALVAEERRGNVVESSLFGELKVQPTEDVKAFKRLQIRPTFAQYRTLQQLADHHGVPLATLTRLVLTEYFAPAARSEQANRGSGTRMRSADAS